MQKNALTINRIKQGYWFTIMLQVTKHSYSMNWQAPQYCGKLVGFIVPNFRETMGGCMT